MSSQQKTPEEKLFESIFGVASKSYIHDIRTKEEREASQKMLKEKIEGASLTSSHIASVRSSSSDTAWVTATPTPLRKWVLL